MTPAWWRELAAAPAYRRGLLELAANDPFAAHEAWEELWRTLPRGTDPASCLQAMIQLCAALVKGAQARPRGSRKLLERAHERLVRLQPAPAWCCELLPTLAAELAWLRRYARWPEVRRERLRDRLVTLLEAASYAEAPDDVVE